MWQLEDDSAVPPLPALLQGRWRKDAPRLRAGCWLIHLDPLFADDYEPALSKYAYPQGWTLAYRGLLRVEDPLAGKTRFKVRASGDLYRWRQPWDNPAPASRVPPMERPSGAPTFPIRDYACYLTVAELSQGRGTLRLRLDTHRFASRQAGWHDPDPLTVELREPVNPADEWEKGGFLEGSLHNRRGTLVGRLQLGWITDRHLRRATVEVAAVEGLAVHLDNGAGQDIPKTFAAVGWEVRTLPLTRIKDDPDRVWKESQLHAAMLHWRSRVDLDQEWRFHVLVVPRFKKGVEHGFGKMYDEGAIDSNLVPREGVVVGARGRFPDDPVYGTAAGKRLEEVQPAYFHNLIHELGHAMGLSHRFVGNHFMQGLVFIADADPAHRFPATLGWSHHPEDVLRLRHYPDIWVRPGGVPFEQGVSFLPAPVSDATTDVDHLFELAVAPSATVLPLGAPLKVHLRLTNRDAAGRTLPAPKELSLTAGSVGGRVVAPGHRPHTFFTARRVNGRRPGPLSVGASLHGSETLLRGPRGELLPAPGRYRLEVDAAWPAPAGYALVTGAAELLVTEPRDAAHAAAALALLGARDLSIPLIFRTAPSALEGTAHEKALRDAVAVLQGALEVDALRPYYAPIEARRLCEEGRLEEAAALVDGDSILTAHEIDKLLEAVEEAQPAVRRTPAVRSLVATCLARASELAAGGWAPATLAERAERLLC